MKNDKNNCRLVLLTFRNMVESDGKTPLQSFQLVPTDNSCPFASALYDPQERTLTIKTKTVQENYQMVNKLNSYGAPIPVKGPNGQTVAAKERLIMNTPVEIYISDRKEIIEYVKEMTGTTLLSNGNELEVQLVKLDTYGVKTQADPEPKSKGRSKK